MQKGNTIITLPGNMLAKGVFKKKKIVRIAPVVTKTDHVEAKAILVNLLSSMISFCSVVKR